MRQKILIADDEPGVVSLLKDYFEINGYAVITAAAGEEAVRQAGRGPDIMLLDINMPGMNGIDVCKRVRAHMACPIIFLTARVEDRDKIAGFMSGGDDYVTKDTLDAGPDRCVFETAGRIYYSHVLPAKTGRD